MFSIYVNNLPFLLTKENFVSQENRNINVHVNISFRSLLNTKHILIKSLFSRWNEGACSYSLRAQYFFLSLLRRFIASSPRRSTSPVRRWNFFTEKNGISVEVNRGVTLRNAEKFGGQRGCFVVAQRKRCNPLSLESLRYPILDETSNTISSRRGNLIK